eukprot:5268867-Amphidinium_carterae.1
MSKGSDGLTPWHKVTGKAYTQPLLPFAETCSWQELGKKRSDLGDRWTDGVFLGVMDNANEQLVAVPAGVRRVRAVRRKSPDMRWIADAVAQVRHYPWKWEGEVGIEDKPPPLSAPVVSGPVVVHLPETAPRRGLYIRKHVELKRFGCTANCPGCLSAATGGPQRPHTQECRQRIESAIEASGDVELQEHLARSRARAAMSGGDEEEASRPSAFVKVEAADGEPGEHRTTWQMQMEEARRQSAPGEHKTTWQVKMELDDERKRASETTADELRQAEAVATGAASADEAMALGLAPGVEASAVGKSTDEMLVPFGMASAVERSTAVERSIDEKLVPLELASAVERSMDKKSTEEKLVPLELASAVERSMDEKSTEEKLVPVKLAAAVERSMDEKSIDEKLVPSAAMGLTIGSAEEVAASTHAAMSSAVDLPFTLQICGLCEEKSRAATVELYSPAKLANVCKGFGIPPGFVFDLRTEGNLSRTEVQEEVWKHLLAQKPFFVLGSPPCSSFSELQGLSVSSERKRAALEEGVKHLEFCIRVYAFQLTHKRHFVHEHPCGAWSWDLPPLLRLRAREGMLSTCIDQCMYGQWVHCRNGSWGREQRPTHFLTSSQAVVSQLGTKCDSKHAHVQPVGGSARRTERYPPHLVHVLLCGMRKQAEMDGVVPVHSVGLTVEEPETSPTPEDLRHDGGTFCDEITGLPLSALGVHKARAEEMQYMRDLQ